MKNISSFKNHSHYPVMLEQIIEICSPKKGGNFIDCTYGAGGFTNAILSFPKTKVISFDRDKNIDKFVSATKKNHKDRFSFFNIKFSDLDKVIDKNFKADFIIFDLGPSSLQILNLDRGFSFNAKGEANMCMGQNSFTASDVINQCDYITLKNILKYFGDEKDCSRIAKNIIKERNISPIKNIPHLVRIIEKSKKKNFKKKINISTQTFQALRIFVNKEISELITGLSKATKFLNTGGKLIVISFHSIEDKIVKFFFSNYSKNRSKGSRYYPSTKNYKILFEKYKNQIIRPHDKEIKENPASRSAKLRYATRSEDHYFYPEDLNIKFSHYLEIEGKNV